MEGLEMHLYCCEDCILLFGVETKFEDQSVVVCPSCQLDTALKDAGMGAVTIIRLPEAEQ